jgi:hypothetical protein
MLTTMSQAAQAVFAGKATVQLQGSVSKGTATFSADVDTFVPHVGIVTEQQRCQFVQHVLANFQRNNIRSREQRGENRIRFFEVYVDG